MQPVLYNPGVQGDTPQTFRMSCFSLRSLWLAVNCRLDFEGLKGRCGIGFGKYGAVNR